MRPCTIPRAGRALALLALLAAGLPGCAPTSALMTPPPSLKPPPGRVGEVTGGVTFSAAGAGRSVTYGPWNLKGGGLELAWAGDGAWTGTRDGAPVRFASSQGSLEGPGTAVRIEQRDGALHLRGTWSGRPIALSVSRAAARGTLNADGCSLSLAGAGDGVIAGPLGCPGTAGRAATASTGTLRLEGEAFLVPNVLLPQFVLALLAVLP